MHAGAPSAAETDWREIVGLYDVLVRADPSPVVRLNRAAAVAMRDGPQAGLALMDDPLGREELVDYAPAHSARAELCRRLGRTDEAIRSYERALELMERKLSMDDMIAVRRAVDRLLGGDLGPRDSPEYTSDSGRQAVVDYFSALGGLVAFWQIDYGAADGQVIAWGRESFRAEPCGLEVDCEFALMFELSGSTIKRFLVIEDLISYFRAGGGRSFRRSGAGGRVAPRAAAIDTHRTTVVGRRMSTSTRLPRSWRWGLGAFQGGREALSISTDRVSDTVGDRRHPCGPPVSPHPQQSQRLLPSSAPGCGRSA